MAESYNFCHVYCIEANFAYALQFPEIVSCKHFAFCPATKFSVNIPTSTITAVSEVMKKIIGNNMGPSEKEMLVVLSLVNQIQLPVSHLFVT